MTTRSNFGSSVSKIPVPVGIAIVTVLVVLVSWWGYHTLAPPPPLLPVAGTPESELTHYLKQKAKECQGNFTQLSAKDQQEVNGKSRGMGQTVMRSYWGDMK